MATVIDSLVLEFGLDPSRFTEGQKRLLESLAKTREQSVAYGKEIESHTHKITELFSAAQRGLLGIGSMFLGGAAGVGIEKFVEALTTGDAALGRLSANLAIAPQALSAWEHAIRRVGGATEDVRGAFSGFTSQMASFVQGMGVGPMFGILKGQPLNIDPLKFINNPEGFFLEVARRVQSGIARGIPLPLMLEQLKRAGLGNEAFFNLLRDPNLGSMLTEGRKLAPSGDDIKRAQDYVDKWKALSDTFFSLGRFLTEDWIPSLTKGLETIKEMIGPAGEVRKAFQGQSTAAEETTQDMHRAIEAARTGDWSKAGQEFFRFMFGRNVLPGGVFGLPDNERPRVGPFPDFSERPQIPPLPPGLRGNESQMNEIATAAGNADMDIDTFIREQYKKATGHYPADTNSPLVRAIVLQSMRRERLERPHSALPPIGAVPRLASSRGGDTITTTSHEANVGQVTINVPSGNPEDIAAGLAGQIKRQVLAQQANAWG